MKSILEFDLPEESDELRDALDGAKWKLVVWDILQDLRSRVKYGESPELPKSLTQDAADELREYVHDVINGYNLNIEL